jgi:thiamine-monophosphate kinase
MRLAVDSPARGVGSGPEVALGPGREFEFIDQAWRAGLAKPATGAVVLGIGDDAALLAPDPGQQLVVAVDTMVEGRHYWPHADPELLGRKLLAVNLSDLAAMGADPLACTLSLSLRPDSNGPWMRAFSQGLRAASLAWSCPLVGGDTVGLPAHAPQVLTLQVLGGVPPGLALRRDGLQPGDDLWVSGCLGDPADAVLTQTDHPKLHSPEPRLALGRRLRGLAHAAIDLSDGLASELAHLHAASEARLGRALCLELALDALSACLGQRLTEHLREGRLSRRDCCRRAAEAGDEYELVFSAPAEHRRTLEDWSHQQGLPLTRLGRVRLAELGEAAGLHWSFQSVACETHERPGAGFDHFKGEQA